MKTHQKNGHDFEQSMIEHERWTNAILRALHELRCASVSGLDRHGYLEADSGITSFISPRAASIPPPAPAPAR
jgi:hypothetical protein